MTKIKEKLRFVINSLLKLIGLRIISNSWGPKGFIFTLNRLSKLNFNPELVIDVGAARGEWSLETYEIFPNAHYFLVDPLPQNLDKLQALKDENSFNFWSGALGSSSQTLDINVHEDQSSFLDSEYVPEERLQVKVTSLTRLLKDNYPEVKNNILLKIDVQGYELEVLRGAEEKLEAIEVVLIEVSFKRIYEGTPLAAEVIGYMNSKGYRIYDICTYAQRPSDNELAQADILFVKQGSPIFIDESWNKYNT